MTTIDGYDLDTLNIMIYNNIDPKKPIELDAKMFMFDTPIKSDNGKMWLCTNIRYSEEILMAKTHFECVQMFFDQTLFLKYIKESSVKKPNNTPAEVGKIKDEVKWSDSEAGICKLKHECFMKENMLLALKYCFTVTFPVNNPPFSYSQGPKSSITIGSFINSWFNSDKYANYTHMKVDGKETTIIGCQWIDTIKYHPVYQKVNKSIKQYLVKVKGPLIKLLEQVIELMDNTIKIKNEEISDKSYDTKTIELFNTYYFDFYTYTKPELHEIAKNQLKLEDLRTFSPVDLKDAIKTTKKDLDDSIDNNKINKLFLIFYYFYYVYKNVIISKDTTDLTSGDFKLLSGKSLNDILTQYNKELKQKLDLILLLCCVLSKDGYNQFVRELGIDQVTLQKYDFHKPLITAFEAITIPNRESTNKDIRDLFDLTGYEITGLYNVYQENGFYNIMNREDQSNDPFIGFDRINLSADKKKAPHFEIYLALEFAGGLVTDTNRRAVSCLFENNRLGNMLQRLIKSEQKSTDILELREYIDLTKLIQKTEKDMKVKAAKDAKEAKEAKDEKDAKDVKEVSVNNAAPNKDNLLQTELDKLPGVTADIQKKIVEKLNKEIPAVKELADTISKYNKEGAPYKPAYDKILTKAKSDVQSLIQNAKYDIDNNPDLTQDKKEKARYDLLDYEKIKELIVQLIDQTFFEKDKERAKKFPEEKITPAVAARGGSYKTRRRRRQRRRFRKTRRI